MLVFNNLLDYTMKKAILTLTTLSALAFTTPSKAQDALKQDTLHSNQAHWEIGLHAKDLHPKGDSKHWGFWVSASMVLIPLSEVEEGHWPDHEKFAHETLEVLLWVDFEIWWFKNHIWLAPFTRILEVEEVLELKKLSPFLAERLNLSSNTLTVAFGLLIPIAVNTEIKVEIWNNLIDGKLTLDWYFVNVWIQADLHTKERRL